ncbi:MAG TPA: hypothetical protein VFZ53_11025, partial [Polyangiaceae bacterium]
MLFGLLTLLVLAGALLVVRARGGRRARESAPDARVMRIEGWGSVVILAGALVPLVPLLEWLDGHPPAYFSDALTHVH